MPGVRPRAPRTGAVAILACGLLVSALLLGACAGPSALLLAHKPSPPPKPDTHVAAEFLAKLDAVQARLARAERRIPRSPRTPRALARSIRLLARGVLRLEAGLATTQPPSSVAPLYRRLVSAARTYAERLKSSARVAGTQRGEVQGAEQLTAATSAATRSFDLILARITARLTH